IWDGDVLLHEWHYPLRERPALEVKADGQLGYAQAEPIDHLVTWIYEANSYVPCGKIVDGKHYSILSDYIGRPIQSYSEEGALVCR
ncbi:RhsD protein, partial [Myroides sp. C20-1]